MTEATIRRVTCGPAETDSEHEAITTFGGYLDDIRGLLDAHHSADSDDERDAAWQEASEYSLWVDYVETQEGMQVDRVIFCTGGPHFEWDHQNQLFVSLPWFDRVEVHPTTEQCDTMNEWVATFFPT